MNHNYFSLTREELGRRILTVNTLNPPLRCAFLYKTNAHRLIPRSVVFFVHKDCSSKRKYASEKLQRPQVCIKGAGRERARLAGILGYKLVVSSEEVGGVNI